MIVEEIDESSIDVTPRLNYSEIAAALKKWGKVFVYMNPKTAYYARRRLSQVLGRKITVTQAIRKETGEKGYYIQLEV